MQIRFLGTGTSTGVPQIGCKCEVCTSANVHDRRLRSSVLISDEKQHVLIDCGPDFRQQALLYGIEQLDGVLLTHEHYDHVGGLDDIRPLGNVPIFAEQRVLEAIKRTMPYCFGEHVYPGAPRISLYPVFEGHNFSLKNWWIEPLRVMHAKLPIMGYRIGKMAYLTDVKSISEQTIQQLHDLDVLVINALQLMEHPAHISLPEAIIIAEQIKAKRTYFTHFSHRIGLHQATESTLPENIFLAYDGLQITVNE